MQQAEQGKMAASLETPMASPPETAVDPGPAGQGSTPPAETAAPEPPLAAEGVAGGATATATASGKQNAAHQGHHQYAPQPLPPGYAIDPATGQIVFVGPVYQQPAYQPPVYQQPVYQQPVYQQPLASQPGVVYVQAETPEQIAARQAMEQQRYGQIMQSFEQFAQGEATISDVVKTLYTNTAQHDQLWKGALVGAAATVLLTSKPVREAMGKTFGAVFPGFKSQPPASGKASAAVDPLTPGKE
jgi:hypothetical protein